MALTDKEIADKVRFEYDTTLKRWKDLQRDFSFETVSFHNVHLNSTIDNIAIIVRRLQMLSYLLEKWDDN